VAISSWISLITNFLTLNAYDLRI